MIHYDLFAGIGGFSLAVDRVWHDQEVKHIFVENDPFCTAFLKKHWPQGEFHGDVKEFRPESTGGFSVLTGGFPCQPFSSAGQKRGTADDRYLWPEMFAVIRSVQPAWVVAENVRGLTSWNNGLVLEQVCADMEGAGYEVQPFVVPAVAKNAPHRRDRVWIVAHAADADGGGNAGELPQAHERQAKERQEKRSAEPGGSGVDASNAERSGRKGHRKKHGLRKGSKEVKVSGSSSNESWNQDWTEVATRLCRVDDGVSQRLVRLPDGTKISYAKWRKEALKAYGNAIVPAIAEEVMTAIKEASLRKGKS